MLSSLVVLPSTSIPDISKFAFHETTDTDTLFKFGHTMLADTNASTNVHTASDGSSTNRSQTATGSSSQVLDAQPGVLGRAGPSARDFAYDVIRAQLARTAVPALGRTEAIADFLNQADATQGGLTIDRRQRMYGSLAPWADHQLEYQGFLTDEWDRSSFMSRMLRFPTEADPTLYPNDTQEAAFGFVDPLGPTEEEARYPIEPRQHGIKASPRSLDRQTSHARDVDVIPAPALATTGGVPHHTPSPVDPTPR